jgi:TRAP-type transport system small permease protein
MQKILNLLRGLDRFILTLLKAFTILSFVLLTLLISANVLVRFFPVVSLHWFDEIIELLYAYLVFYGAAALWITREHFSVGDWISGRLIRNPKTIRAYRLLLESLVLAFALIFFYYSWRLTGMAMDVTNVFAIPKKILYSCMPISGLVMTLYSLRNIALEIAGLAGIETSGATRP